jgi:glycosyltransferase involved in cell wall biosynthesis
MPAKIILPMPSYNGLKFIEQAINSVLAQSIPDRKLIVSDDGSIDGTVEYLQSLLDERIKVFYTTWRCDHGCDGTSGLMQLELEVLRTIIEPQDSDLYFFLFGCIAGNRSNVSVRTDVVVKVGWYRTDLPYAGNFEFWSRTGRVRPWALSRSSVVQVRRHAEQASRTLNNKGELLPQLHLVVQGLFEALRDQGHELSELRWFATTNYVAQQIDGGIAGASPRANVS